MTLSSVVRLKQEMSGWLNRYVVLAGYIYIYIYNLAFETWHSKVTTNAVSHALEEGKMTDETFFKMMGIDILIKYVYYIFGDVPTPRF